MSSRGCAAARRLLACILAGVFTAANGVEGLGLSAAAAIALERLEYESLVVEVTVNAQRRGEFSVYRDRAGEFYFKLADIAALGLDARAFMPTVRIDDEAWVALRSLGPGEIAFDESRVRLVLTFPAPRLIEHVYDLAPRRPAKAVEPRERAAFINYRL